MKQHPPKPADGTIFDFPAGPRIGDPVPLEPTPTPQRRNWREDAERWIQANPEVFRMYESIALEYAKTGCAFGIDLVTCILRWERRFDWSETFKINSNYRAYIARALMQKHPQLGTLMKIRKTRY